MRPTRDGIHGREYINTCIELSRRNTRLQFKEDMSIASDMPPLFEIPIPLLFQQPDFGILSENVFQAIVRSAFELDTMIFILPEYYSEDLIPYTRCLIPCLTKDNYQDFLNQIPGIRMIELAYESGIEDEFAQLRAMDPELIISVGLPLNDRAASRALKLTQTDVDTLHFCADHRGNAQDAGKPRFLKEMIREIHLKLVEKLIRNKVNLVFSGGIAMAEHMAKAIICGADGVTVDHSLLIALECRFCGRCIDGKSCPVKLGEIDAEWGSHRIINLIGAWRNQLLEVMGAMGIREARRLRGEVGRSLWFEDLERENFGPLFGERKVAGLG